MTFLCLFRKLMEGFDPWPITKFSFRRCPIEISYRKVLPHFLDPPNGPFPRSYENFKLIEPLLFRRGGHITSAYDPFRFSNRASSLLSRISFSFCLINLMAISSKYPSVVAVFGSILPVRT